MIFFFPTFMQDIATYSAQQENFASTMWCTHSRYSCPCGRYNQCFRVLWPLHSTVCKSPQTVWYGRRACNTSRKQVMCFMLMLIYYRRQKTWNHITTTWLWSWAVAVVVFLSSRCQTCFFKPLWQEKTRNSAHEQTPLSKDTINSVLRQWEVGRSKDLSALPCTLVKNRANFLGITFSCCTFHHQELVDCTVRSFARICIPWWCKQRNSWLVDASRLRPTERELTILSHKQGEK